MKIIYNLIGNWPEPKYLERDIGKFRYNCSVEKVYTEDNITYVNLQYGGREVRQTVHPDDFDYKHDWEPGKHR